MKNREKYEQEILDSAEVDCGEGNFIKNKILPDMGKECDDITCTMCPLIIGIWLEKEYNELATDWSKVSVDTPIFVRDSKYEDWRRRYFAKYDDKTVFAFYNGATSWSNDDVRAWQCAKLPEQEDPQ